MSRDLVTAEFGTELEELWAQLRFHKIGAIPVVDRAHRVIGIITLIDILKRANLRTYKTFEENLKAFIRRTPDDYATKPETVGQVMTSNVFTVYEHQHIRSGPTNLNNPTAKLSDGTAIGYAASAILGRVS